MMKLLCLLLIVQLVRGDKVVTTTNGPVRGISLAPKKVEAFLGIPYAEPPVGPLRLAKPVSKSTSEEIYDANELPPSCVQAKLGKVYYAPDPEAKMSENCLYLNLWVPEGGSDRKPIMLFIHGGGFMVGSTNMKIYDGANLAEHGDVIVATINYRLGTLGFFSGFIDEAEGSMGMYDQVMAIQWVKDNAENFRGDPENIVLMGESAGGFSVSMHMISPLSKNLFRRAILQSGTAISPMYTDNQALSVTSQLIATMSGCTKDNEALKKNPKDIVNCLKSLPTEKISEMDSTFLKNHGGLFPRIGDAFLPKNPLESFREGNFKDTELLVGITRDEGPILLTAQRSELFGLFGEKADSVELTEKSAKEILQILSTAGDVEENDKIIQRYFDRVKNEQEYTYLKAITDILGDFVITCGSVFQADYHSLRDNPVYFYLFDYRSPSSPLAEWLGVAHFDEIQYVFGNPMHQEFSEYEEEFSKDVMDMWVAFAKRGNPTIPGGLEWPRYSYKDQKYFIIGKKDRVGVKPDNGRCENWRKMFQSVIDDDVIQNFKKTA